MMLTVIGSTVSQKFPNLRLIGTFNRIRKINNRKDMLILRTHRMRALEEVESYGHIF